MNKVQQKYSVLKVKQYKQEIEDLEKKANINKWFIYGSVGHMTFQAIKLKDIIKTK